MRIDARHIVSFLALAAFAFLAIASAAPHAN